MRPADISRCHDWPCEAMNHAAYRVPPADVGPTRYALS